MGESLIPTPEETLILEELRTRKDAGNSILKAAAELLIQKRKNSPPQGVARPDKYRPEDRVDKIAEEKLQTDGYQITLGLLIATEEFIATGSNQAPDTEPPFSSGEKHLDNLMLQAFSEILKVDPSGFSLLDRLTKSQKNQGVGIRRKDDVMEIFSNEARCAVEDYKKIYLLAAQAGLSPLPKEVSSPENLIPS